MNLHPGEWAGRALSILDSVRSSYWFIPVAMAFGSVIGAFLLIGLEPSLGSWIVDRVPWIVAGDANGTRGVLSVIAGSMITVTGVVFSITVVALTLASSQFGPRLLRNFIRDRVNQLAFGAFIATFLFSLLVLRAVPESGGPHLAVSIAVVLGTASIFVLIYFIHHTAKSIQASTVISSVAGEIEAYIDRYIPLREETDDEPDPPSEDEIPETGADWCAPRNGYVRIIGETEVAEFADEHDLVFRFRCRPGDFVNEGERLVCVAPAARLTEEVRERLRRTVVIGSERSAVQDLRFLIGQLTELAVRALSPGINDPRTAVMCAERIGSMVSALASRQMPSQYLRNASGALCVILPRLTFEEIVEHGFDPLRQYGAGHVEVVLSIFQALSRCGERIDDPDRRTVLANQLQETFRMFPIERFSERDIETVTSRFGEAMEELEPGPARS